MSRGPLKRVKLNAQDRNLLKPSDQHSLVTHVVVCGFPRAGSTLLQVMVQACVRDAQTLEGEVEVLWAAEHANRSKPFMLTKLPSDIERIGRIRDVYASRKGKPRFVLMVRDPRAVLTSRYKTYTASRGYYVEPQRWREVWQCVQGHQANEDVLILPYEQLVRHPGQAQWRLSEFLGWAVAHPFADYHEFSSIQRDSMTEGALGGLRPLDQSSLDRWRGAEHAPRMSELLETLPECPRLAST